MDSDSISEDLSYGLIFLSYQARPRGGSRVVGTYVGVFIFGNTCWFVFSLTRKLKYPIDTYFTIKLRNLLLNPNCKLKI